MKLSIGNKKYIFDKDEFVNNYNKLRSSRKMAKLYGCDKGIILKFAKEIGYKNEQTGMLSISQKEEIISQYNNKTSSELAEEYGVSRGQITKIWYDNNLIGKDRHTYPFDYGYFENIDANDKAYFLGLLASDGNVFNRNKEGTQAIIKLSLQKEDRNILEIFKVYLGSKQPLYITERKSSYMNYMYTLELVSNKMAEDLKKYNIIPYKTYNYEMILLEDKYMSHYFRGYFDGDGSISCTNNMFHTPSQYNISICGFEHNLLLMKDYLYNKVGINSFIVLDKRDNKKNKYNLPFGNLILPNINEKYKFLRYIYKDRRDIYLSRKQYLSECFINAIEQNYSNKQNKYNNILMPS